jgi:hypothetical protein
MKVFAVDNFLVKGSAGLPSGAFRAIAIHPSSEVDLIKVNGRLLGPGTLLPMTPGETPSIESVRFAPTVYEGASDITDRSQAGQLAVVQLYEACDSLDPPGPRVPSLRYGKVLAANLGAVIGAANIIARVPFSGRRMARISFMRTANPVDLSLVIMGVVWGTKVDGGIGPGLEGHVVQQITQTWWNGAGAAPTITAGGVAGLGQARIIYVGGGADAEEGFDELVLFVFGGAGAGDAVVFAESYGERVQ